MRRERGHAAVIHGHCSERGQVGKKWADVSGASVWPMKILAATFRDFAPLAPMKTRHTLAASLMMSCMIP